jgi:hypothetical protein
MSTLRLDLRMLHFAAFFAALALAGTLAAAPAARAQVWTEGGDAGDLPATAQHTAGFGALSQINGALGSANDVDLYCIRLTAVPPAGLPIVSLQCVVIQGPNVWLFDAAGNGVFTSQTCSGGNKTILAPNVSLPAGLYYVGVSYYGVEPQSPTGPIWLPALPGQRAPDGPGAPGPLTGWAGVPNVQPLNPYTLTFNFMGYCDAAVGTTHATWGALKTFYR